MPLGRVAAASPSVVAGDNGLSFTGKGSEGFPRVEVTLFAMGEAEPATVAALSDSQKRELAVEYELPRVFNPEKGLSADCEVKVRPGETAKIGFEILGPAKNPTVAGQTLAIALETEADKIVSEDGEHWKAVRVVPGKTGNDNRVALSRRKPLGEGVLPRPLVLGGGSTRITYASDVVGSRVTFVKYYKAP